MPGELLFALAHIDRLKIIFEAEFLQRDRYSHTVGGGVGVNLYHVRILTFYLSKSNCDRRAEGRAEHFPPAPFPAQDCGPNLRSVLRDATIDEKFDARDVTAVFRGKENGSLRQIVGRPHAIERNIGNQR
jgi:hypothetical protein